MSFPRALIHELKDGTVIYAWHPSIAEAKAPADFAHTVAIPVCWTPCRTAAPEVI